MYRLALGLFVASSSDIERLIALGFSDTSPRSGCGSGRKTTRRGSDYPHGIRTCIVRILWQEFWIVLRLRMTFRKEERVETNSTDRTRVGLSLTRVCVIVKKDVRMTADGL
jgi:hypothetical protein